MILNPVRQVSDRQVPEAGQRILFALLSELPVPIGPWLGVLESSHSAGHSGMHHRATISQLVYFPSSLFSLTVSWARVAAHSSSISFFHSSPFS